MFMAAAVVLSVGMVCWTALRITQIVVVYLASRDTDPEERQPCIGFRMPTRRDEDDEEDE